MIFECLKLNIPVEEDHFNSIYPEWIGPMAQQHFTPVEVAKLAAAYLVDKPGTRVLDIGSGSGKFCMIGASCTSGHFTGIEQRSNLVALSLKLSRHYKVNRVDFICANITTMDMSRYDAFYFFNSFQEQIDDSARIDEQVHTDRTLYTLYHDYMYDQLSRAPVGTRLATYWGITDKIPPCYTLEATECQGLLKLWKKIS
jgi:hypothetical protein